MNDDIRNAISILNEAYMNRNLDELEEYSGRDWPAKDLAFTGLLNEIEYRISHKDVVYCNSNEMGSSE